MMNFNYLEWEMNHLFWCLSNINEFHNAQNRMLQARTFEKRISLIEKSGQLKLRNQRGCSRLNRLVTRLREVNEKRNDLIHGMWVSLGVPASILRHKPPDQWLQLSATPASIRADSIKTLRVALSVRRLSIHILKNKKREGQEKAPP